MLTVNQRFPSLDQLKKTIHDFCEKNNFCFDEVVDHNSYVVVCKRKREFGCKAQIQTILKKRERQYVIKRIKLKHKCPPLKESTSEFIKNELQAMNINQNNSRIGELVELLAKKNVRFGYHQIYKALTNDNEDGYENCNKKWVEEFLQINPNCNAFSNQYSIFVTFPYILSLTRKVIEIKIKENKNHTLIYAIAYDPADNPVIYSFSINATTLENSLQFFFDSMRENNNLYNEVTFIVEYEDTLISLLEKMKINYFIKIRSICKKLFNGSKEEVERIWNYCNLDVEYNMDLKVPAIRCRIPVIGDTLFNIQNFSEIDLDLLYHTTNGYEYYDCINAIIKIISDTIKKQITNLEDNQGNKNRYSENVTYRLEKNISLSKNATNITNTEVIMDNEKYSVDFNNGSCSCGMYQYLKIPCYHACAIIMNKNNIKDIKKNKNDCISNDPSDYVDPIYSNNLLLEIYKEIKPVVNEQIKITDRAFIKKGPGRPKKIDLN
ncbi:hypothetical protein SLOPH_2473 [Spraguea lophii 42_110]|uniref:SWIM-type domain-containing protein n=1 Tax=Spraguea lophii (strain 42_110) TaxID=1358809 RepID=S7XV64_SPRLO|nr:hypothetical protein SLOPH_2473 [Spraguea lophii 42_110]